MPNISAAKTLNARRLVNFGIPLIIALSYLFIAFQADLRQSVAQLAGASALVAALLAAALYLAETKNAGWHPALIVALAAAFRLLFVFRQPELSDDIFRYLWDGLTTLHGGNPYALAPADAMPVADGLPGRVNHPHLITIYPPAAQIIFAAGAFLGDVLGIKFMLAAADVAVCVMMLSILKRMGLPPSRAVVYAWHPLPVLEVAASGHIDGAGVFFLMLAFLLLMPKADAPSLQGTDGWLRPAFAGGFFSAAVLIKLFPLVFFPPLLFLAEKRGRGAFVAGSFFSAAFLSVPFMPALFNMLGTLDVYARNWEFAGFAFQSLSRLFFDGAVARMVLAAVFIMITAFVYRPLLRGRDGSAGSSVSAAFKAAYAVALAFLLLTPTLHPWYALYLACLLPFVPGAAGLVMAWGVLLSYRVLIAFSATGVWEEKDNIPALIFFATLAAPLVCRLLLRKGSARKDTVFSK